MDNSLNNLYLKYVNSVGPALEDDRYFQYLFESLMASDNVIEQKNQVLRKVVDEEWIDIIEDTIASIYKIIDKPRRFVTTSSEVVPVELAKKITGDSVRHLSQNTQFLEGTENGEVHPSKILNVTTEESFDLYENRFIYHLIQRMVTFIDKRTDIIFWLTNDEKRSVLNFQTRVDDAYEQIEYNLEMKVTNRQSFAENDDQNMEVFMRIDRVRRLVTALRHSSFCQIMSGCAKVRSPIQRTNLLMKDPDYRKCYRLWQYLEGYDQVGYKIVEENTTTQFDEEYLYQLYTNFITSYSLFKTVTDPDNRDIENLLRQKRRVKSPKFIHQIKEEFVDSPDIPDVEIRRVFVEEVTQAQLDAEAALEESKKENALLNEKIGSLNERITAAADEIRVAKLELSAAKADVVAANGERDAAIEAKNAAEESQARAVRDAAKRIEEADIARLNAENARKAAEDAKEIADIARIAAEEAAKKATASANEKIAEAAKAVADLESFKAASAEELERTKVDAANELLRTKNAAAEELANTKTEAENKFKAAAAAAAAELAAAIASAKEKFDAFKLEAEEKFNNAQAAAASELEQTKTAAAQKLAEMISVKDEEIASIKTASADEIAAAKKDAENKITAALQDADAKVAAAKDAADDLIAKTKADADDRVSLAEKLKAEAIAAKQNYEKEVEETVRVAKAAKASADEIAVKAEKELKASTAVKAEADAIKAEADGLMTEADSLKKEAEEMVAAIKKQAAEAVAAAQAEKNAAVTAAEKAKSVAVSAAEKERDIATRAAQKANTRYEKEKAARLKAQEKAKEGTLGKYIASRLAERHNRNENSSDKQD